MKLCHNCPDRRQGCHAVCEDYLAYRAKKDEEIEKNRKEQMITAVKLTSKIQSITKWKRGHRHV